MDKYVVDLHTIGMDDVGRVGGKNASLGEMIHNLNALGVQVPNGFATTAEAYRLFLSEAGLTNKINESLAQLDVEDVQALADKQGFETRPVAMKSTHHAEMTELLIGRNLDWVVGTEG